MVKQVIVVNKGLNMSKGKMAAQVSHASMAFLTRPFYLNKECSNLITKVSGWVTDCNDDNSLNDDYHCLNCGRKLKMTYSELMAHRENGRYLFCDSCGARMDTYINPFVDKYECRLSVDNDVLEWMNGSFTKVICEVKNEHGLEKVVAKALENGFVENEDFFKIIDEGRTEFNGVPTWTCIGFKPMANEKIDVITKKLQLFKE